MHTCAPIKVAVLGVGFMGQQHARIYNSLPQCELVAVADTDSVRANAVAHAYNCAAYESVASLLVAHPKLDAVSITVPTTKHEEIATQTIQEKIPSLVEKPLASSLEEAQRIVRLAKANNTIVQVGHIERFNPAIEAVSNLSIEPLFIKIDRVSPMPFRSLDIDVVLDIMIHDLDLALMFTNTKSVPTEVEALGVHIDDAPIHLAQARITLPNGCLVDVTASRIALHSKRKIRIFTSDAYINIDCKEPRATMLMLDDYLESLETAQSLLASGISLTEEDLSGLVRVKNLLPQATFNRDHQLRKELTDFLSNVKHRKEPLVNVEIGLNALALAEVVKSRMKCVSKASFTTPP